MRGRIKEDDSSVPAPDGPFAYFHKYREGGQHEQIARQPRDGGEARFIIDGDELAKQTEWLRARGMTWADVNALDQEGQQNLQAAYRRWVGVQEGRAPVEAPAPPVVETPEKTAIDTAAAEAEPNPTSAQKEAGNYKKGHVDFQGLDVTIENPRGSTRSGVRPDGAPWQSTLPDHYGYIKKTMGADGDHVDAYIGPDPAAPTAFVVDQIDPRTGGFDEHKVMLGYPDAASARAAYEGGFSDGSGASRLGAMTELPVDGLKAWLDAGDTTRPVGNLPPPFVTEFPGKNGPLYAVQPQFQRGSDEFRALARQATGLGGQYDIGTLPRGFMFSDREAAIRFAQIVKETKNPPEAPPAPPPEPCVASQSVPLPPVPACPETTFPPAPPPPLVPL